MGFALSEMTVTSHAFSHGGIIPKKHTQEGENTSPALAWSGAPEDTRAFAVVCHDPDAPLVTPGGHYGFVHWALYGIPGSEGALPEGVKDFTRGKNETGELGYTGPMPPKGHGVHNYFFWVMALKEPVELPQGLSMWELFAEIEPHVLGMNRLLGVYERT